MARTRNLKPGSCKNELLAKLKPHVRLLWNFLPCHADCMGRLEDRPKRLHIEIFPYETKLDIDKMLQALHDKKFIVRYEVDGEKFIWIKKFLKHQNPHKNEREKGSEIPSYDSESIIRSQNGTDPDKDGTDPTESLNLSPLNLNTESEKSAEDKKSIAIVFDHYKKIFSKTEAYRLTEFRRDLVLKALKQGYGVGQMISVIDTMSVDDWDQRPKYSDIRYALEISGKRDRIDEWLSKFKKIKPKSTTFELPRISNS